MAPAAPAGALPPTPPELPCSSPLLGFISPRQHGPHRGFTHASGPSSQPQQQGPLYKPLWLPALPLATHMRSELPAGQRSECACLKGGLIKAQRRSWKGNLKGVCATGRRAIGRNERGTVRLL